MSGIEQALGCVKGKIAESKLLATTYLSQRPYMIPVLMVVGSLVLSATSAAVEVAITGQINGHSYSMQANSTIDASIDLPESLKNVSGVIDIDYLAKNSTVFPNQVKSASLQQGDVAFAQNYLNQKIAELKSI